MHKALGVMLVFLLLATLACGLADDVQDVVETVDEGVSLLQEIEESGTWEYIGSGLDGLADHDGYIASVRLQDGTVDEADAFVGALDEDLTINWQVDAENDALVRVIENDTVREYLVDDSRDSNQPAQVYQIENGRYRCVSGSDDTRRLEVDHVFESYGVEAVGVQLLSVAEEVGEDTVAGRTATHYQLESRVPEALALLKKLDNKDLQAKIDEAGEFALSGDMYLDEETGALLRFDSGYRDYDGQRRLNFQFQVTQWGGVDDIPLPASDLIDEACPDNP